MFLPKITVLLQNNYFFNRILTKYILGRGKRAMNVTFYLTTSFDADLEREFKYGLL